MSCAHQLRMLSQRTADSELLFLHQSRATEDAFAEAAYRWPDERGRHITSHHLATIAQLFPSTLSALVELTRSMESAAFHGHAVEDHLILARGKAEEVVAAESTAVRLSDNAQQIAGFAASRSRAAVARADGVSGDLSVLGGPPI
jgi:hypothetical protein